MADCDCCARRQRGENQGGCAAVLLLVIGVLFLLFGCSAEASTVHHPKPRWKKSGAFHSVVTWKPRRGAWRKEA